MSLQIFPFSGFNDKVFQYSQILEHFEWNGVFCKALADQTRFHELNRSIHDVICFCGSMIGHGKK